MSSNLEFMPHTNGMLGVVVFEESEAEPGSVVTTVHHAIGWLVSMTVKAIPVVPDVPPKYFKDNKWYPFFMPEAMVLNFGEHGMSVKLEEAIAAKQQDLILRDEEENPKPTYNH